MTQELQHGTALLLLLCQLSATFYMMGLVWFVQQVRLPGQRPCP